MDVFRASRNTAIGILTFGAGALAPIVPHEMQWLYAYQTHTDNVHVEYHASNTPPTVSSIESKFPDNDGNGLISVAVFSDRKGNEIEIQIPDEQYADMGRSTHEGKGALSNPKRDEYISVFEALTPRTKAAIALGNTSSSSNTGASSLTFAAPTITGSDTILFIASYIYRFSSLTSVTYNGSGATQISSTMAVEGNRFLSLYYVVAPTSAANVVITGSGTDGSRGIRGVAVYYTGASQTGVPDAVGTAGPTTGPTLTATTNVATANSWVIAIAGSPAGTGITSSTGVTERANVTTGAPDSLAVGDSNAALSAGNYDTTFTNNGDSFGQIAASFAPAAAVAAPYQSVFEID